MRSSVCRVLSDVQLHLGAVWIETESVSTVVQLTSGRRAQALEQRENGSGFAGFSQIR